MYSTSTDYKNKILADSTKHLLNVYIDNNKIEDRYILECKLSYSLLENDEFCFGSTPAKTVTLKIHKNALPDTYDRFYIESGIAGEVVPIGYFNVDEISKDDDYTVSLTLIDDMSKFEFNYDGSALDYPATILTVLQDICSKAGVELGSTSFLNSDKQVAVYDSTVTARNYLSYIAEQAGGFAIIGRDGKLYIRKIEESNYTTFEGNNIFLENSVDGKIGNLSIKGDSKQEMVPASGNPIEIENIKGKIDIIIENSDKSNQQSLIFYLAKNQKLMSKDYLSDDGIHHASKQIELNGTEVWNILNWPTTKEDTIIFYSNTIIDRVVDIVKLCNYFRCVQNTAENLNKDEEFLFNDIQGSINISISKSIASTPEEFKKWLSDRKSVGKPVIVEYEMTKEEIEPYTAEQKQNYNSLQDISTYDSGTYIISNNANVKGTYLAHISTEFDLRYFSEYSWGERFKVSRIAYEDGIQDFKQGDETNNTIWINSNNMYIVDKEQIINIYNKYKDFDVYSFSGTAIVDPAWDIGDIITIDGRKVVYQGDLEYKGKFKATISSDIQAKTREETTVTKISDATKIRRVQSLIDQINATITLLLRETGEYDEKFVEIQASLDGITQTVESMEDFTREKTQPENLYLDDIAEGEGYVIKFIVYGNTELFNNNEITICVSSNPRGYGNAIYLLTEDEQELLTEDGQQISIGQGSYFITSLQLTLDGVLRNLIEDGVEYNDTLEIEQDGTINVVRRIGVDEYGDLYILPEEQITTLEEKLVLSSTKDGVYYFLRELTGLKYYANYITENDYSDTFLTKLELGTQITQNAESVRVAWNQISEFIQMMIINNNASLAILDKDNNVMMSLDKEGLSFYKNGETEPFGEMGVKKVEEDNYVSFSVLGDYDSTIQDGMAWGITNKSTGQFFPILYIKNFNLGPEDSEIGYGELVLEACDLIMDMNASIHMGNLKLSTGGATGDLIFLNKETNETLLLIGAPNVVRDYPIIEILDNIIFSKNQNGSNSFKVGNNGDDYCLLSDDGSLSCKNILCSEDIYSWGYLTVENGITCSNGYVSGIAFIDNSREETKKNIEKFNKKAIDIINDTEIYEFNYKAEKDNDKKHVGFVIGKDYKYAREITAESENKEIGADLYSMVSIAYKAIQEQQEEMDELKEIIKKQQGQINKLLQGTK